ncbi:MAG: class I SAM-dependent methyltransferase, partial [Balneolales bacterium]|nr:class I SAM-dependent methyltransferase [Balneolales bacterium]
MDHASTEALRAKYRDDSSVDISKIVEVDYIWGNENPFPTKSGQNKFDYVLASHVVEHVPDLIGWLKEIHSVLRVGGILS